MAMGEEIMTASGAEGSDVDGSVDVSVRHAEIRCMDWTARNPIQKLLYGI